MATGSDGVNVFEGQSGNRSLVLLKDAKNKYDKLWIKVNSATNQGNINKVVKLTWDSGDFYKISPSFPEDTAKGDAYYVFSDVPEIDKQGTNPDPNSKGCFGIPQLEDITLSFPLGLSLSPILPPGVANTNCAVAFNLLAQLNALLPILAVLLKLLQCIGILFEVIKWGKDNIPPKNIFGILTIFIDLAKQLDKIAECVGIVIPSIIPPIGFICMVESIIKLIIMLLKCVQTTLESIIASISSLGVGLSIAIDDPNDDLLAALKCFMGDFTSNMEGLQVIMAAILEIMNIYTLIADIVGQGDSVDLGQLTELQNEVNGVITQMSAFDITSLSQYVSAVDDILKVMNSIPATIGTIITILQTVLAPLSLLCGGKLPNFITEEI